MKIKHGCETSTDDFWYDLAHGGYLDPWEILEDESEAEKVVNAILIIKEFEDSCEEQIEGFFQ